MKFSVEELPRVNTKKDEEIALDNISAIGSVGGDLRSDREKHCDKTYQTVTIGSVSYIYYLYIT